MGAVAIDPLVWLNLVATLMGALVIGVLVAIVLCAVCIAWAASDLQGEGGRRSSRHVSALPYIGLCLALSAAAMPVRSPAQDVPEIEPRYTRVFGSDTVTILFPKISPDGRWIAYSRWENGGSEVWIVSVDGGDPVRLTSGGWNIASGWFPASDRIAYFSSQVMGVMTMPVDTETGDAAGPAQRVTLEEAINRPILVSPDGEWIAYHTRTEDGAGRTIRVVPAQGGTARTVTELPGSPRLETWSRDGRYIYFTWRDAGARATPEWRRVSVADGTMQEVREPPTGDARPRVPYRIEAAASGSDGGDPSFVIRTLDGSAVARLDLPRDATGGVLAADGRNVVAVVDNSVSPLRVLPVAGGEARQLGDARASDFPIGWTADSRRVIYLTRLDGRNAVMAAPLDGGAAEEYTVLPDLGFNDPNDPVMVSESGRYLAYPGPVAGSDLTTLAIARAADGRTRQVTSARYTPPRTGLSDRGGLPSHGDTFIYLERGDQALELRAASFDGPSRLLRTFPTDYATGIRAIGVYGDRVAWTETVDGETVVMLAEGPDGAARELARTRAALAELVWSPDGRRIAAAAYLSSTGFRVMFLDLTADGQVESGPRLVESSMVVGWGIRWLPEGRAVTLIAQSMPTWGADVWLVPVGEGGTPVALTRDEAADIWFYQLSPDGRYVAYPGEVGRGSSLWMVDLGDALP